MNGTAAERRLQILMVSFNRVGQGTFRRAHDLGRSLGQRGHSVTLLATSRTNRTGMDETDGYDISLIETPDLFGGSLRSGWDLWNTYNRLRWIRGRKFDVVHAFESRPAVLFPALRVQATAGALLVMDWADWFGRGGSVEERPNILLRSVLRPVETYFEESFRSRAQGATVISKMLSRKAREVGVPEERILLLINGSDPDRLRPMAAGKARRQLGLPESGPYIGHMGAIFQRDARLMAAAFDRVVSAVPAARLLVAGYCPFDIREMSRNPDAVIQTGYVAEDLLNAHLAACDVLWLPMEASNANRGRLPLKVNDYLAVGRPVVATDVGDWPQRIRDQKFGVVTSPNPTAFATATIELLGDETRLKNMGQIARQTAAAKYRWSDLAEKLERFYLALIAYDLEAA